MKQNLFLLPELPLYLYWAMLYSCCIVLYSRCLVFYSCCLGLCRVVLVLCRVDSCCYSCCLVFCCVVLLLCRVVSCCVVLARVVTRVVFQTRLLIFAIMVVLHIKIFSEQVHNRSSHQRCSIKKLFLNILQYSQGNTCVVVSFNEHSTRPVWLNG